MDISRHPIDTQVYQISYKQDKNCDRQAGDKFHQTDTRQTDNIFIAFSQSQRSKTCKKKVSTQLKKKKIRDCSNICPLGVRIYKNSMCDLGTAGRTDEDGSLPLMRRCCYITSAPCVCLHKLPEVRKLGSVGNNNVIYI